MAELLDLLFHRKGFARQKISDGLGEHGVANPVCAVDRDGHQAAPQLVRALGARFETAHSMVDGVLDEPLVAELEMVHVVSLGGTPIAAVKMPSLGKIDRCRDDAPFVSCRENQW
jgi:hypothetical protein